MIQVAEVLLTGVAPLGAVSHRFNLIQKFRIHFILGNVIFRTGQVQEDK